MAFAPALLVCELALRRTGPASFRALDAGETVDVDAGETFTGADASKSSDLSKVSPGFCFAELIVSSI